MLPVPPPPPRRRRFWGVATVLLWTVILCVPVWTVAVFWHLFNSAFDDTPTKDVRAYPGTLAQWRDSGLVAHFPVAVPPEATEARFFAVPKVLQGEAHIQLSLALPRERIEQVAASAAAGAVYVHPARTSLTFPADPPPADPTSSPAAAPPPGDVPRPAWYTAPSMARTGPENFPDDFTIFFLHARATGSPGHRWNHGTTSGIAISRTRGLVVYWAAWW